MQPVKVLEFTSLMGDEKQLMKRLAEQLAVGECHTS